MPVVDKPALGVDRFELRRALGAGGMGEVWEAWDRERASRVALKTLTSLDGDAVLRFKHEFQAFQELHHPNLVRLGELFASGTSWFFTMELVDGVELLEWVRPNKDAPPDELRLRSVLKQLASALAAVHAAGLVHRDVKPSNILVDREGRLVLLDFGLATERRDRPVTPGPSRGQIVGTVDYMAPEQAADAARVAPPADWYAMGVLLYEALTGRVPFVGGAIEVLLRKQQEEPPPPRTLAPDVAPDLDELCTSLLACDPAARPDGRRVLEQLSSSASVLRLQQLAAPPPEDAPPFVGREEELALLDQAWADARNHAVAVLIEGESGVGKTALVRRFVDTRGIDGAHGSGAPLVLTARCYERASVPFKGFDGVIDSLSNWLASLPRDQAAAYLPRRASLLAQVFPVLRRVEAVARAPIDAAERRGGVDPNEQRSRVFLAVCELLQRIAEQRPLLLLIDDLQWADADSLALLAEILQPSNAPPLLLIATRWSEDSQELAGGDVRRLGLAPLPRADASRLAERLLAHAPEASRATVAPEAIAASSGGHPLFLAELVRHAGSTTGRTRLEDALWARIERLDAIPRRLLSLLAVARSPLGQQVAARATQLGLEELARVAAPMRVAHLLRSSGARATDVIDLYHHQVRQAVLAHLDPAERRALHERLALALEAEPQPPLEALAQHWREAGDVVRAAGYAARGGAEAAATLTFERAASLYRLALELDPDCAGARELRVELGHALAHAGRGAAAADAYREAAEGAEPAQAVDLQQRAATEYLRAGLIDEGLAMLENVLRRFGTRLPATPGRTLLSIMLGRARLAFRSRTPRVRDARELAPEVLQRLDAYWAVGLGLSMVDAVRGADFLTRHLLLALEAGEPTRLAPALAWEATFFATSGRAPKRADALLEHATTLARDSGDAHAIAAVLGARAVVAYARGEWRRAVEAALEAEQIFRDQCVGVRWELSTNDLFLRYALYGLGECRALRERVESGLRECEELGDRYGATNLRLGPSNMTRLFVGDPDGARARVEEARRLWTRQGFHMQHHFAVVSEAQIDLYLGDATQALERLEAAAADQRSSKLMRLLTVKVTWHDLLARSALACAAAAVPSERERFLALARASLAELQRAPLRWTRAHAQLYRAALVCLDGDRARAAQELADAARAYDACDMKLSAAVTRRRQGQLVGGDEGRALIAAAESWMASEEVRDPERICALFAPGFAF